MSDPNENDPQFEDDQQQDQQDQDDQQQQYDNGGDGGGDDGAPPNQPPQDDDEEEAEPIPAFLPAEHRLMAPVQAALKRELVKRDDAISLQLREKEAGLLQIKKKREELGVELYSTQQGLAKLQLFLEKQHEKYERAVEARLQEEVQLKQALETYQRTCAMRDELEKKRLVAQKELDGVNVTVNQIEAWNEKVKSEIKVTRRNAYGTEDSMQAAEKAKIKQDEQLDKLNEVIRQAQEQISIYDAQIISQKAQTKAAQTTLKEAQAEMERIVLEKRKFMALWQSSLQGMSARDDALQIAQQSVFEQQEKLQSLTLALNGYKNAIKSEQNENEKLSGVQNRIQSEVKFMETQLATIHETRRAYNAKYTIFRQTLERVDLELKASLGEQRQVKVELDSLHKAYEKLMHEKQEIDDAIMESINDQTTLEKGAQGVWKATQKLKQQVHEKEIQMGDVQNEIARIQVDALNTGAHNKELTSTLEAYEKELKEKNKLIEKYEMEIRQRHDKIEKKQIYIARLNRKYEVLTSNIEEVNTGPLEATITNLQKEMAQTQKDSAEKQREWIKIQTELVTLVAETAGIAEEARELQSRETIFNQKSLRSSNLVTTLRKETKEIGQNIKNMHNDMARLNELIATQSKLQSDLANENYTFETDYMLKLKSLELKSIESDALVQRLKEEKEAIFAEMIEVEKQIMLWEKKIQLERETQEALDPEYGQPEIKGMKKEIHRMKLRLTQLKRQQEKMIQEMERTITKRETIKVINTSSKSSAATTAAQLKKKILGLKAELQTTNKEARRVVEDITKQEEQNQILAEELEKQQQVYNSLEDNRQLLLAKIDDATFKRTMALEATILNQKRAARYADALAGKKTVSLSKEKVIAELVKEEEKFAQIKEAIHRMQQDNPKHAEYFQRLLTYM